MSNGTPAENDEIREWKRVIRLVIAGAVIVGGIGFILGVKNHNLNKEYDKQVKQNKTLSDKITGLEGEIVIFKAKNEDLENTIFTSDYYPAVKELQNKAKKDPKIKKFVDYLGFLESEAREKSPTIEAYNKNLKDILFEKSKNNSYFRENISYFPPYLLKHLPSNK